MKQRAIEVVAQPNGELQIDAVGFQGAECERATAFLEQALGRIEAKTRKPEFYRQTRLANQQKVST
jgi:hypothetical protein